MNLIKRDILIRGYSRIQDNVAATIVLSMVTLPNHASYLISNARIQGTQLTVIALIVSAPALIPSFYAVSIVAWSVDRNKIYLE